MRTGGACPKAICGAHAPSAMIRLRLVIMLLLLKPQNHAGLSDYGTRFHVSRVRKYRYGSNAQVSVAKAIKGAIKVGVLDLGLLGVRETIPPKLESVKAGGAI